MLDRAWRISYCGMHGLIVNEVMQADNCVAALYRQQGKETGTLPDQRRRHVRERGAFIAYLTDIFPELARPPDRAKIEHLALHKAFVCNFSMPD